MGTRTISGTVYDDVDADANVAEAGTLRLAGATVRLYTDAGTLGTIDGADGTLVATATTDANGQYSFVGITSGRYWVAVDSRTLTASTGLNAGSTIGNIWADQTYAVDGVSGTTVVAGAATRYSGRSAATSDVATTLANSEHVVMVNATAGNVTTRDFGFSFNVVTNTLGGDAQDDDATAARTVQGSLRQFIQNANALTGANVMRFVPAAAPNVVTGAYNDNNTFTVVDDGGNDWWRITVTAGNQLPTLTDAGTTIDGTAYSRFDGSTLANTNQGVIGYTGAVGLGADGIAGTGDDPVALSGIVLPELEIMEVGVGDVDIGLDIQANNTTVRAIAIHGFGTPGDIFTDGDIVVGRNIGGDVGVNLTGILIEDNIIGAAPNDNFAVLTPPADRSTNGITIMGADGGTIQRNMIAYAGWFGAFLSNDADGWTVSPQRLPLQRT